MDPAAVTMNTSEKFRIVLNMSHFYNDHRSIAYLLVSSQMLTIADLENKISRIFGICNFYLAYKDKYLPSAEDIVVLEKEDLIWVVPIGLPVNSDTKNDMFRSKQNIPDKHEQSENILSEEECIEPKYKRRKLQTKINNFSCDTVETDVGHTTQNGELIQKETISSNDVTLKAKKKKKSSKLLNRLEPNVEDQIPYNKGLVETEASKCLDESKKRRSKNEIIVQMSPDYMNQDKNHDDISRVNSMHKSQVVTYISDRESIDNSGSKKPKMKRKKDNVVKTSVDSSVDYYGFYNDISTKHCSKQERQIENCITNSLMHDRNTCEYQIKNLRSKQIDAGINTKDFNSVKSNDQVSQDSLEDVNNANTNISFHILQNDEGKSSLAILKNPDLHNKSFDPADCLQNGVRKESKTKASIKSHFIVESDGNVFQQSLPFEVDRSDTDVTATNQHNEGVKGSGGSPRLSLGKLLSELRQTNNSLNSTVSSDMLATNQHCEGVETSDVSSRVSLGKLLELCESNKSPNSAVSSDCNTSSRRKRIRKRKRKTKEPKEPEVKVVYTPKPLIVAGKPAVHIKFDNGTEEECDDIKIKCCQNQESAISDRKHSLDTNHVTEICEEQELSLPDPQKTETGVETVNHEQAPVSVNNNNSSIFQEHKGVDDAVLSISEPVKAVNNTSDKKIEFSKEIMVDPPSVGNTICFKIFRMNENYNPEISSAIIGNVQSCDSETNKVAVKICDGLDQCMDPKGKFHLDLGQIEPEDESEIREFIWSELIEPKLQITLH